jgi:glycerophosphoryl diester phosphodiesterase
VDAALCGEAHRGGFAVYTWTVDDPPTMRRLADAGVDGIMTNDPRAMRATVTD